MDVPELADVRRIVREELRALRTAELAIVQEIHPHADAGDDDNFACTVRLRDTGLVLTRVPVATGRLGIATIPDLGDLVLVQFVGGDVNAPIIVGSLYNDEDRPPQNAEGEVVLVLPTHAAEDEGVQIRLRSADETSLVMTLGASLRIALRDDDPAIEIGVGDGSATVRIESDGTLTVASSRAINIEGGDITLKGTTITAEADSEIALKSAIINLN